jgi:uncharacterized coiled-coil protein SlyX
MRRLKKATPEFEEVEEGDAGEEGWINWQSDRPDMDKLRPLLRTAEAMLDPTKPNSYHIKLSAAKKLVRDLGKDFTIEGDAIVKALPFKVEYSYKLNPADKGYDETMYGILRGYLEAIPSQHVRGIEGIALFNEGKTPANPKKGWLYISVPIMTSVSCGVNAPFGPQRRNIHGERAINGSASGLPTRLPRNGIRNGELDFAVVAPQTIYIKFYISTNYMADVIYEAIALGAQRAMTLEGGNVTLKEWVPEAGSQYRQDREKRLAATETEIKAQEQTISSAADTILATSLQLEANRDLLATLKQPFSARAFLKEMPNLEQIEWINRDDPYKTVVRTKDIILHGVNLGPYVITMIHNTMNVAVMGTKVAPDGIVHPNIWQKDGKWQQDMPADTIKALVVALGAADMHRAVNILIGNLLNCPKDGDHGKRLEALRVAIADYDAKEKAKVERKAKKAEAPKVEPKVEEPIKETVA